MRSVRNLACLAVFTFGSISLAAAQQPAQGSAAQPPVAQAPATQAPATAEATADTAKPTTPQTPQQKQLADDTAKLLTLANELKAELDKSSKDTLSLSVIKKAEQVEKLAHKVRDEMKASVQN
jgi:sRNA-binding protein